MPTANIAWGDGTGDVITVEYSGEVGSSDMTVASTPNKTLNSRNQTITLKDYTGVVRATLIVTQKPRSRAYSIDYNNSYK